MKTIIRTQDAPAAIGPYSQAGMARNLRVVSGQIALNPATGEKIPISRPRIEAPRETWA